MIEIGTDVVDRDGCVVMQDICDWPYTKREAPESTVASGYRDPLAIVAVQLKPEKLLIEPITA